MTTEEIKQSVSMMEIAEVYGIKVDKNDFCRCIYHNERIPSMKLYKDSFYCFSCQKSGDVFTFVQKMEDIPFREAFQKLGGTYGHESGLSKYQLQRQKVIRKQKRLETEQKENDFKRWRCGKLSEACDMLRLCDNADGLYEPFSAEWVYLFNMRQKNEYRYQILGFGSKQDQEEMRYYDG